MDLETGELFEYRHLMAIPNYRAVWGRASRNEIGKLVKGIPGPVEGTNMMLFIKKEEVSQEQFHDITHGKIVIDYHKNNDKKRECG